MDIKFIVLLVILILAITTNILVYHRLLKKDEQMPDNSNMQAQIILMDRKINDIRDDIEYISDNISKEVVSNNEIVEVVELDELTRYFKSDMKISEIAKKMNKSVKEVELMLKLKGLV